MAEKILKEEILSDEELEKVSGGNVIETSEDSMFLYDRGLMDDWYDDYFETPYWESEREAVKAGWKKAGITCVLTPKARNEYYLEGKKISRDEALSIVDKKYRLVRNYD